MQVRYGVARVTAAVAAALVLVAGCSAGTSSSGPSSSAPSAGLSTSAAPTAPTSPSRSTSSTPSEGPTAPTSPAGPTNYPDSDLLAPVVPTTDLPTVTLDDLPKQAVETLTLIKAGGPYPYANDGIIFQNREKVLPAQGFGFYHEYTVVTPGSSDRGARRIVTGADGSRFWTDDHYRTFHEVIAS